MTASQRRPLGSWLSIAAAFAVLFGFLTIWEGGSVVFRGQAGSDPDYVPFVVTFNFLAGFAYVTAGAGLWFRRPWARRLALIICASTLVVFGAFAVHILSGGAYEMRTVIAMTVRVTIWAAIASLAYRVATPSKLWAE